MKNSPPFFNECKDSPFIKTEEAVSKEYFQDSFFMKMKGKSI